LMANCGCWIDSEEMCSTYVVIDEEVRLRRLGDWEIPMQLSAEEPL